MGKSESWIRFSGSGAFSICFRRHTDLLVVDLPSHKNWLFPKTRLHCQLSNALAGCSFPESEKDAIPSCSSLFSTLWRGDYGPVMASRSYFCLSNHERSWEWHSGVSGPTGSID